MAGEQNEGDLEYLLINEMSAEQKLETASRLKNDGADLFQCDRFRAAHKSFHQSLKFTVSAAGDIDLADRPPSGDDDAPSHDESLSARIKFLKVALYLNIAACLQKNVADSKREKRIVDCCSKALEMDPVNVKALYRRARAWAELGEWARSRSDLARGLECEPENKALKTELARVYKREKDYNALMSKRMANLFV